MVDEAVSISKSERKKLQRLYREGRAAEISKERYLDDISKEHLLLQNLRFD